MELELRRLKKVDIKYRSFMEYGASKLGKYSTDGFFIDIYNDTQPHYLNSPKYVISTFHNDYILKLEIHPDDTIQFSFEYMGNQTILLSRLISYVNLHICEVDYFVDSCESIISIFEKQQILSDEYGSNELPIKYKRSHTLDQLLD